MQQLLEKLCMAAGVSGDENGALDVAEQILAPLGEIERTAAHSIICRLPAADKNLPHVMLTAHIDQIGLMVTKITDKGFIKTASCGGVDRRSAAGARVTIHAGDKKIKGVVIATPPHLSDGKSLPPKAEGMTVDSASLPAPLVALRLRGKTCHAPEFRQQPVGALARHEFQQVFAVDILFLLEYSAGDAYALKRERAD